MLMDSKDKKTNKNKSYIAAFEFAFQGLKTAFIEERNVKTHTVAAVLALFAGFIFRLSRYEWLWLLFCIFFVVITEIINTAFENVVDMVTNYHYNDLGKKIKDMGAGAVLLASVFAILVGGILFVPKVIELFKAIQ